MDQKVYKSIKDQSQSLWRGLNDLEGTCYAVPADKGSMTTAVFNSWFFKCFLMVSKRPLLVITDGNSNLDRGIIEHHFV